MSIAALRVESEGCLSCGGIYRLKTPWAWSWFLGLGKSTLFPFLAFFFNKRQDQSTEEAYAHSIW